MIGFSFYLSDQNAEKRIKDAGNKGVKQAFTSLHIPEESVDMAKKAENY
ncbi:MupG family TIM beta-alpha barrel fold protein [Metabacillus sp. RGM 3146]